MVADKSNMRQVLTDFPKQCRDALTLAQSMKASKPISSILVCGMGGSAVGGDILKVFMADISIPVYVTKDYTIPAVVDSKTLVFAISYSGNTEETLAALTEAKNRGATVVGITTGGQLADMVDTLIKIPSGLQPRNALGYLFFPMIGFLFNSGVLKISNSDLNQLLKIVGDVEYFDEKGKDIARKIKDKIPIIYSSAQMEPAAYRLKCELNENGKHPAWNSVFPEMCHNELVGFESMERSKFIVLMVRNSDDHDRIKKRMDICKDLFEHHVDVEEVLGLGDTLPQKLFSIIYLGDWISFHLAMWKRVDPTPVYVIEDLKQHLKK